MIHNYCLDGNKDADSIDLFTEEAGEEMFEDDASNQDGDDDEPHYSHYMDFFDPPPSDIKSTDATEAKPLTPFEKQQKKVIHQSYYL